MSRRTSEIFRTRRTSDGGLRPLGEGSWSLTLFIQGAIELRERETRLGSIEIKPRADIRLKSKDQGT
jgi:hypothetical protein